MPIRVGNKIYNTVQERLIAAHGDKAQPEGIENVSTTVETVGAGAVVVRATVTFSDGRSFSGMSLARFDATSGADRTNPIECAETSAVGRCLAFAGYYGTDDGLAGAEEIRTARQVAAHLDRAPQPTPIHSEAPPWPNSSAPAEPPPPRQTASGDADKWGDPPPTENQQKALAALARKVGGVVPAGLTRSTASDLIGRWSQEVATAPRLIGNAWFASGNESTTCSKPRSRRMSAPLLGGQTGEGRYTPERGVSDA